MAKQTQRLIAILLTLALSISLLPAALATEEDSSAPVSATAGEQEEQGGEDQPAEEPEEPAQDTETEDESNGNHKDEGKQKSGSNTSNQSKSSGGSPSTYAVSSGSTLSYKPYPSMTYRESTGTVTPGQIRFVSQMVGSGNYHSSYWSGVDRPISYCWMASMSMSLSYLGINKLPKDIKKVSNSETNAPKKNWGATYLETDKMNLDEAVENYVNSNGCYSPPVVMVYSDCYNSTDHHTFVVIGKKSDGTYLITDPVDTGSNPVRVLTVSGNKAKSTKTSTGSAVYNFTIQRVYQYYNAHETWLEDGELDFQGGILPQGSGVSVKGKVGGTEQITSVTAGCYNLAGKAVKGCNETVTVNSVGCDLSELNSKLKFSQLTPGYYTYRVTATMATGEKRVLGEQKFTVRYAKKSLNNATFYFDNGENIKLCTTAVNQTKGSTLQLQRNIEGDHMRIKAKSVGQNGYYTLQVEETGQYLTVYKSQNKSGTKVIQHPRVQKDGQYWQILPAGKSGYYYLMPKCAPDCCLSVANNEIEAGSPLEIRTATTDEAQSWLLRYTRPLISSVKNVSSGLQVSWKAPAYATGYYIYRAVSNSDSWSLVKKLTSGTQSNWTDSNVTNGVKYRYKVLAIYTSAKSPSCPQGHRYRVTRPATLKAKNTASKKLTVNWSENKKASGYQICYADNKSFSRNKVVTVKGGSKKAAILSGLTKGKTYYVKVRAYKAVDQNNYYSAWTSSQAVKVVK